MPFDCIASKAPSDEWSDFSIRPLLRACLDPFSELIDVFVNDVLTSTDYVAFAFSSRIKVANFL